MNRAHAPGPAPLDVAFCDLPWDGHRRRAATPVVTNQRLPLHAPAPPSPLPLKHQCQHRRPDRWRRAVPAAHTSAPIAPGRPRIGGDLVHSHFSIRRRDLSPHASSTESVDVRSDTVLNRPFQACVVSNHS